MNIQEFWAAIKEVGDWMLEGGDVESMVEFLRHGTDGSLRTGSLGHAWEQRFIAECRNRNLDTRDVSRQQKKYDVVVSGKRVQCKYIGKGRSDIGPRGRNSFGIRGYHVRDFDVLAVAVSRLDNYCIIPSASLANGEGLLTTRFRAHLYEWKGRWEVLADNGIKDTSLLFQ